MAADNGKHTATAVAAGGLAGLIAGLLANRPTQAASPDEKLDHLISLNEAIAASLATVAGTSIAILEAIQAISPGPALTEILTPWVAKDQVKIYGKAIRAAGVYYGNFMADCRKSKRQLFKIESSLDVSVAVQIIGDIIDNGSSRALATDIGLSVALSAGGNTSIGLAWDDWHPFVGVQFTLVTAPTQGQITCWFVSQN